MKNYIKSGAKVTVVRVEVGPTLADVATTGRVHAVVVERDRNIATVRYLNNRTGMFHTDWLRKGWL